MYRFPDRRSVIAWVVALALAVPGGVLRAASGDDTPTDAVRTSNQLVIEAFGEAEVLDDDGAARVREIMDSYTDFEALSGAAVDGPCAEFDPEPCRRLKEAFSELLRVSSIRKLGRYRADAFDYVEELVDGDAARVRTLAHYGDRAMPLDYELRRAPDGRWRVVNYTLNRVNTVRVYRKQFVRLLAQESVEEVIARLERKTDEFRRGLQVSPGPVRRRD